MLSSGLVLVYYVRPEIVDTFHSILVLVMFLSSKMSVNSGRLMLCAAMVYTLIFYLFNALVLLFTALAIISYLLLRMVKKFDLASLIMHYIKVFCDLSLAMHILSCCVIWFSLAV